LIFGIARLSSNFLVQLLARSYIEVLRNIPLLVLLIFLYTAVFIKFPRVRRRLSCLDPSCSPTRASPSLGYPDRGLLSLCPLPGDRVASRNSRVRVIEGV
jgi:ABC-type amino acid transport system permease subunit